MEHCWALSIVEMRLCSRCRHLYTEVWTQGLKSERLPTTTISNTLDHSALFTALASGSDNNFRVIVHFRPRPARRRASRLAAIRFFTTDNAIHCSTMTVIVEISTMHSFLVECMKRRSKATEKMGVLTRFSSLPRSGCLTQHTLCIPY